MRSDGASPTNRNVWPGDIVWWRDELGSARPAIVLEVWRPGDAHSPANLRVLLVLGDRSLEGVEYGNGPGQWDYR